MGQRRRDSVGARSAGRGWKLRSWSAPPSLADVCLGKTGDAERSATSRAYALSADLPIRKGAISFEGKVPAPWRATSWGWSRCPSWIRTPQSPFSSAPRERSCASCPLRGRSGPRVIRGRGPRVRQRGEGTTGLEAVRVKAEGPPAWLSRDQGIPLPPVFGGDETGRSSWFYVG